MKNFANELLNMKSQLQEKIKNITPIIEPLRSNEANKIQPDGQNHFHFIQKKL